MRSYECLYIVHPGADSSELETTASKYKDLVAEKGAEVKKVDQLGKRKLAYEIDKLSDGNYILMRFDAEPGTIKDLEFRMRVDDRVLRYLTCYEIPEGAGQSDELMQLTERKERDRRGRGGRKGGGGRFGRRDDRGPRRFDRDDRGGRDERETRDKAPSEGQADRPTPATANAPSAGPADKPAPAAAKAPSQEESQ